MCRQSILTKYRLDDQVRNLIFVKYKGNACANILLYEKEGLLWKTVWSGEGYVGRNGIGKQKEGDGKTPSGIYTVLQAFGICPDPGSRIPYLQITENHYWCTKGKYYNRLIDQNRCPLKCAGEHLIEYKDLYDYGLFLDYNKECRQGRGSAIFMHCKGERNSTAGCIAVPKRHMKKIIKRIEKNTKICIY